tara:strand:+ start:161 stop:508 length:348 start_codon:yes stop_codon:yes gene_type:complete
MWIRILGILYNLTLVQSIEYCIKKKELYFHYGLRGSYTGRSQTSSFATQQYPIEDTVTISFIRHDYGNEYGLAVYAQIIKELKVFDSDPIESDRVLGIAGPPFEGAHPDAEFIEG